MEKENENYYSMLGLYRGNGKEAGNYNSMWGVKRFMRIPL